MNPTRLSQLIDAYLDCALTPEEASELSTVLVRSAEARKQFWSQAALHGVLPDAVQAQWLAQAEPGHAAKVIAMPVVNRKIVRFAWLAAAACLMLTALWWGSRQEWWPMQGPTVAQLERAPGAMWEGRRAPTRGSSIKAGHYRLISGAVELRMQSGARLIVEAPADFDLLGRNEARLHSGQCSGFVPPEAVGFRIAAPNFTLTDLGTAFGIKVPPAGPTEAHVFEGEVEVAAEHASALRLVQGEAVQVDAGTFASIAARPDDFLSAERLAARDSEKARRRIDQWRELAGRLSNDPATLVHFTCEDQDRWDTALHNTAHSPDADSRTAMIMGAAWSEGRWPGKKAIVFREPGDRVRFEVPGRPTQLTLLASICVDALPNEYNALLMTENLTLGDLRWEILKNGQLELCVRTGRVADGEKFERVSTPPVIDDTMLGRWLTIATTYDGATGEIAHYVEGELVARERTERATPTSLGALELGNWGIQLDDPKWTWTKQNGPSFYQRNFTGRIDQFAMLSRVLKPEEVKVYSLGR